MRARAGLAEVDEDDEGAAAAGMVPHRDPVAATERETERENQMEREGNLEG